MIDLPPVRIGRLTARVSDEAAGRVINTRNEISFLLNGADLEPVGAAPGSILIIKSLNDPAPGQFRSPNSRFRVSADWERAARDRIEELRRAAARPIRGQIAPDSEAVLFADEAEMLACLALDLCHGLATHRWWWESIRSSLPVGGVFEVLRERAAQLPAVMDVLESWRAAEDIRQTFSETEAWVLASAAANSHGAHLLARVCAPDHDTSTMIEEAANSANLVHWFSSLVKLTKNGEIQVLADETELTRAIFQEIQRTIFSKPVEARSPEFAAAVSRTRSLAAGSSVVASEEPLPHRETSLSGLPIDVQLDAKRNESSVSAINHSSNADDVSRRPVDEYTLTHSTVSVDDSSPVDTKPGKTGSEPIDDLQAPSLKDVGANTSLEEASIENIGLHCFEPQFETEFEITTDLAGIFYLINVLTKIDPPLPLELSRWAALEVLALTLLELDHDIDLDSVANDPVWSTLRELDHRESDEPPSSAVNTCIGQQLPSFQDSLPDSHVLLFHRARLVITRTRVDVLFRLDQISLPVRSAGLDANPGWRPEFGRIIKFHFLAPA